MKKFKVLRDTYGYKNRLWKANEIIEVADGEEPKFPESKHFALVDGDGKEIITDVPVEQSDPEPQTMSELAHRGGKGPETVSSQKAKARTAHHKK